MNERPAKPRGRPGRKAETPEQRIARLERDLADARRAVEEAEARKLANVGRAVLAEAESNATFMAELRRVLGQHITTKAGKAELAGILGNATPAPGNPAPAAASA